MKFPFSQIFPETELAFQAISEAAKKVLEIYGADFKASEKEDKSPVTLADIESHKTISKVLLGSDITIVSEEGEQQSGNSKSRFWLVDPLDGTKEFLNVARNLSLYFFAV